LDRCCEFEHQHGETGKRGARDAMLILKVDFQLFKISCDESRRVKRSARLKRKIVSSMVVFISTNYRVWYCVYELFDYAHDSSNLMSS
jgi:hypothetical protein